MRSILTLIIGIMLLATALPASAVEGEYFSLSGTVTDANWNPIPGALVSLYDNDFNQITTQDTNSQGYFAFQGVSVKSNVCHVRVSYTDSSGVEHKIPGYYIPAITAKGDIQVDPAQTHFDDYYLPGSQPKATPTPAPVPTSNPTATPVPVPANSDTVTPVLLFLAGLLTGASVATLACFIVMRPKKP
jgi:hypothetical protein